jgi:hypothetical protein
MIKTEKISCLIIVALLINRYCLYRRIDVYEENIRIISNAQAATLWSCPSLFINQEWSPGIEKWEMTGRN